MALRRIPPIPHRIITAVVVCPEVIILRIHRDATTLVRPILLRVMVGHQTTMDREVVVESPLWGHHLTRHSPFPHSGLLAQHLPQPRLPHRDIPPHHHLITTRNSRRASHQRHLFQICPDKTHLIRQYLLDQARFPRLRSAVITIHHHLHRIPTILIATRLQRRRLILHMEDQAHLDITVDLIITIIQLHTIAILRYTMALLVQRHQWHHANDFLGRLSKKKR